MGDESVEAGPEEELVRGDSSVLVTWDESSKLERWVEMERTMSVCSSKDITKQDFYKQWNGDGEWQVRYEFRISSLAESIDGDVAMKTKFVVFQRKGSPGVVNKEFQRLLI